MRSSATVFFVLLNIVLCLVWTAAKKIKDEDFSEFDDFDEDEFVVETASPAGSTPAPSRAQANKPEPSNSDGPPPPSVSKTATTPKGVQADTNDASVDDEDDDLMFDDEEFETSDSFASASPSTSSPDLKFAEVPHSLTGNRWEAYHCEALMVIALLGYLINFLIGRSKNARLAATFYRSQRDLLERNFALVGDNGQTKSIQPSSNDDTNNTESPPDNMLKESESLYVLWCSGRSAIESMLIELRFIKRQCLFNSIAGMIKSVNDMVVYTIDYSKDDMETFVMCLAKKRCAAKLHRDMNDLSQFCSDRKNADKRGLGVNYQLMSEIGEVSTSLVDNRVVDFVDKFPDALEYIHITDQYTGMKAQNGEQQQPTSSASSNSGNTANGTSTAGSAAQQQDALNTSERAVRRVLIVAFNLTARKDRSLYVTTESIGGDYLRLVLHLIDRVSAFRYASKDSKMKAIKNRQRVEELFLKNVYQQRQEQAQQRREDKRRAEKEKIMQLDDPERQRKWEEKEHKREMKRRQPKMKQMKVKAM